LGHEALWDGENSYPIISSARMNIHREPEFWNVKLLAIQVL